MSLLAIAIMAAVLLSIAYRVYGSLLQRLLGLDAQAPTPAVLLKDDIDYAPIESKFLLSQHFSAIAAAGPIVGPILAGLWFGWAPALIWILVGSILIGGVHDLTALVASVRHKARSRPRSCESICPPRPMCCSCSLSGSPWSTSSPLEDLWKGVGLGGDRNSYLMDVRDEQLESAAVRVRRRSTEQRLLGP